MPSIDSSVAFGVAADCGRVSEEDRNLDKVQELVV